MFSRRLRLVHMLALRSAAKGEGAPAPQTQTVQNCHTETVYENRVVGYNVTYEYAGKQYMVQMPKDPGPTVTVNVTPVLR